MQGHVDGDGEPIVQAARESGSRPRRRRRWLRWLLLLPVVFVLVSLLPVLVEVLRHRRDAPT